MNIGFTTARVLTVVACLIRLASIASVAQTVTFLPTSLSFGNQVLGTASTVKKITLTNNQRTVLHITNIAAHVADYVATSTCPMGPLLGLASGASCKISVTFTPSLLGPRTDTLSVADDGNGSPQTVPLSGSGVTAPVSVSPASVSFKNQVVGTRSAATTVTLKNNQTGALTIWAITTNLSDFSPTTSCPIYPLTLNGGSSCTISVTFKPALTGSRAGVLRASNSADFNPTVSLSGTGIPAVVLNPTGLSFGNQAVGTTSAVQAITVTNNQTVGLAITSIATSVSDFMPTSNCPASPSTLPANASCTVNVAFTPKAIGARAGTLRVTDNASNSPQTASLGGTGLARTLVSIAVNPQSASMPVGKTQPFTAVGTYSDGSTQNLTGSVAWSSSAAAISTVSSAGVATSVSPGTTNIIAKSGTITGSGSLQVGPPALISLSVNPSSAAAPLGTTQQFTATGTYTDASTQNLTSSINWSSSSPSVAGVSSSGLATAATTGSATITAASGAITASANLSVVQPVLVSIAITPSNPSFALGTTKQLKATGTYSDGSTLDLTTSAKWGSALSTIATVDGQGLATSVSQGSASVTATAGSTSGSTTLTVTPAALVSIAVTPAIPQISLGTTQQFTATGTFTDGSNQNITKTVGWSSNTTGVATISNAQSSPGLATSVTAGSATITATSGSVTGTTTLTVTAAALASIAVTPPDPSIALGTKQQFTATATFTDGSTQNLTSTSTWSSNTTSTASIDPTGLATSAGIGTSTVSASSGTVTGSTVLMVTAATLVSIAINPQTVAVPLGGAPQFSAIGTYSDGTTQNLTQLGHWSSTNASVATISNSGGTQGLALTLSTGTTTIAISSGSVSASATMTVSPATLVSIAVTPANVSIALGAQQQFSATGTFTDGSTQDLTSTSTWSSDTTSTASINPTGLATSAGIGTSTVSASSGTVTGSTVLMVTAATLVSIAINPQTVAVPLGGAPQFTAIGTYSDGTTQNLTQLGHWSSTNASVATISNSGGTQGLALTLSTGTTTIAISSGSVSASATMTVGAAALVSIAIVPATPIIPLGTTQQFTAAGTYTDSSIQDVTSTATWSSSSANIAVISNNAGTAGLATGSGLGTTNITAVLGPVSSSTLLTVGNAALVSILVTPISPSVALGFPQQFAATGTYSDGSTQDLTRSVNWTSSLSTVAAIGAGGLAGSTSIGSTSITATLGSLNASSLLTVSPPVPVSLLVTPSNPSVFLGGQQQFAATLVYSDGSSQNVTSGVSWTSSNPTVATVGNGGLASAIASGSATVEAAWGANLLVSSTTIAVLLPTISITPATASAMLGSTQQFIATMTGSSNQNVSWTVDGVANGNSTIGTISATGLYTAPPMIGSHTIAAIAQSSSSIQSTATVTVGSSGPIPNTFFGMHLNNIADPIPASMEGSARIWDSAGAQWPSVNTASGIFNWNTLDTLLADYKLAGINDVLYTLWRVPGWASSNPTDTNCDYLAGGFTGGCDPPTDLNADGTGSNLIWRTWVQNIAQHVNDPIYLQSHARVKYWDPCNECYRSPTLNVGYGAANYSYRGTYAQLVRMMQDARCIIVGNPADAITALNATCGQAGYPVIGIDPTAQMMMPDTAPGRAGTKQNPYAQVMQNILYCTCANNSCSASSTGCPTGAGGSGAVDIIASHLYADTYTPEQLPTQAALVRSYLSQSDLEKPFWSIEGGWGRNTALQVQSDPDLEAAFVARYNLMVWASGTTRAYWYGWDYTVFGTLWGTAATNGCSTQYANGYICTPGIAYQQIHDWLLGAVLTACSVVGTTWDCRLTESTGAPADIVWDTSQSCSSGSCGTIQHSVAPEYIKYRDLTGATLTVSGSMVPVGIKPILLETQ